MNSTLWDLPSPSTITYFWNFGSTLGICLIFQVTTGLFLTFHYTSFADESFSSVVHIMRDVWTGWVFRLIHINGASVFFLFVYLHLFRGLFYASFTHNNVWITGTTLIILLIAISFLGYVLPWGQISYWAVAVITNLFSVIPLVGDAIVNWLWGGFSVGAPTLTRFYSFHFLLPFVLMAATSLHLLTLHEQGSSNSLGLNSNLDNIQFHPYFSINDFLFIAAVFLGSMAITFYFPFILGDAVNNIPANSIQTPLHIQPEWYFLTSYAILRGIPSKTAGVLALVASVSIFYTLPLFRIDFSTNFDFSRQYIFWAIIFSFLFLINIGSSPAEEPFIALSNLVSIIYFSSILTLSL